MSCQITISVCVYVLKKNVRFRKTNWTEKKKQLNKSRAF